jgi:DNA-binding transcriptional ArsR family regulator
MERDLLKGYLDEGLSLEQIGAAENLHPSTVGYWVGRHDLTPAGRAKHSPRGGVREEVLAALVDQGLSQREIAAELKVSQATIRYWLRRFDLRTSRTGSRARPGDPKRPRVCRVCRRHGRTEFVLEGRGSYRCRRCRVEAVSEARRRLKRLLVREAGGRCAICGYDRCEAALEFHHLNPKEKRFSISHGGLTRSLADLRQEAKKCILLCANCHAEVEAGVTQVPVQFLRERSSGVVRAA